MRLNPWLSLSLACVLMVACASVFAAPATSASSRTASGDYIVVSGALGYVVNCSADASSATILDGSTQCPVLEVSNGNQYGFACAAPTGRVCWFINGEQPSAPPPPPPPASAPSGAEISYSAQPGAWVLVVGCVLATCLGVVAGKQR